MTGGGGPYQAGGDPAACMCLDSGVYVAELTIRFTDQSDCVRLSGGVYYNSVYLFGGDDTVVVDGTSNYLHGGDGDDSMAVTGDIANYLYGGGGDLCREINRWALRSSSRRARRGDLAAASARPRQSDFGVPAQVATTSSAEPATETPSTAELEKT